MSYISFLEINVKNLHVASKPCKIFSNSVTQPYLFYNLKYADQYLTMGC